MSHRRRHCTSFTGRPLAGGGRGGEEEEEKVGGIV
jgi:hypothetical protein